ncbi:MAG: 3,4-dihydroxy-2-butanone-4-phosphate synthase [Pseudomonadota bacterium]
MNSDDDALWRATFSEILSSAEEIIEEARNGRMFILVDDEGRENEGDLVIPAQMATPAAINFMARFGRGLICLAMTRSRIKELGLPLMQRHNESRHETAFTLSIEAREGVTTGISAPDRARTVSVAIDPASGSHDIVTPGHVFPLMARDGGVLVRAGHTEAAVDISRLAGLNPSGVICEIMNDDGTMARRDDLIAFAQTHGLKIATIADLIAYRRRHDRLVEQTVRRDIDTEVAGRFQMAVYVNVENNDEHIALWKGDLASGDEPILVRVHVLSVMDDVLGDRSRGKAGMLEAAMRLVNEAGRGVIILIQESSTPHLSETLSEAAGEAWEVGSELREYGIGAQILLDLGVTNMIVLSNTERTIVGLEGYGLQVSGHRPIGASNDKDAEG